MKKKFAVLLLVILTLILTGCERSNLAVMSDETSAKIIAKNASTDMFSASSGFGIAEGQKLYIEPSLTKGEISIKLKKVDLSNGNAKIKELTDAVSGENADMEIKVSGSDTLVYELDPGSYSVYVSVLSKADGTVQMSVR